MSLLLKEYINLLKENDLIAKYSGSSAEKIPVANLTYNSKEVTKNTLFVCKGAAFKAQYLLEAVKSGAFAYVSETDYGVDIPAIIVKDVRAAMPILAKAFYEIPEQALNIIGITGTKGKTTTCYYLRKIFDAYYEKNNKPKCAFLTSLETYDGKETIMSGNTTPEIFEGYKHLRSAYDSGIKTVIMEVSSQGLKYGRVNGIPFSAGAILNISPDHISPIEHPDFDDYFDSKLKLFDQCENVVINRDCDYSDVMLKCAWMANGVYTYGHYNDSDYKISDVYEEDGHVFFYLNGEGKDISFELGMRGVFNIENAVCAIIIARLYGVPFSIMQEALKDVSIAGRGEEYETKDKAITCIVDYAHNAISCQKIIEAAKSEWPDRKIISIFGCPGGKALNRREGMGQVVSMLSDKIILTADDPANEDVVDICKEIAMYIKDCSYEIIADREEAIAKAFSDITEPSAIMILGKGSETAQKIGKVSTPYISDGAVARKCIEYYDNSHKIGE